MLVRYDLARRTVMAIRFDIYEMNGCYGSEVKAGEMDAQLVRSVMQTRRGLDEAKILEMVRALWECEG